MTVVPTQAIGSCVVASLGYLERHPHQKSKPRFKRFKKKKTELKLTVWRWASNNYISDDFISRFLV